MTQARSLLICWLTSALSLLICVVGLLGQSLGATRLSSIDSSWQQLAIMTAVGLGSIALLRLLPQRFISVRRSLAALAALIGAAELVSHMASGADLISPFVGQLLFFEASAGRTSTASACSILVLALLAWPSNQLASAVRQLLAGLVFVVSGTALLGYLYGAHDLYSIPVFNSMSLNTSLAVLLGAIAAVLSVTDRGWAHTIWAESEPGRATRRQISLLVLPVVLGGLLVYWVNHGRIGIGAAMTLLVMTTIASSFVLILRDGRTLETLEQERRTRALLRGEHLRDLEARLREQAEHLNRSNAEREHALTAMRQSQKMEAIGQLTGGVAHDFNNLLAPIVTTLDVFIRKGAASDREVRLLQGAQRSAERARTLIQRLLAFARQQPLQVGSVDLKKLIEGMSELIPSTLGSKIQYQLHLDPDLPLAFGDPHQLEMAILNLCINARDAMADGGRLLLSACANSLTKDNQAGLPAGNYLCISIEDTGHGMDPDTKRRAVEPFFSTKEVGKGTGLGLSMAHGLASQLGGALLIESEVSVGTRVDIWLPQNAAFAENAPTAASEHESFAFQGRVLVVDDEEYVRASTCDMLSELGFEATSVDSAENAANVLKRDSAFALLVTDEVMPGMTGGQLAVIVRREWPEISVLIVSGYTKLDRQANDAAFLAKPFLMTELADTLSGLLRSRA